MIDPLFHKEVALRALAEFESQLVVTEITRLVNYPAWQRQIDRFALNDPSFSSADYEAAKKGLAEIEYKIWSLRKGIENARREYAAVLAYEPPTPSESPAEAPAPPAAD